MQVILRFKFWKPGLCLLELESAKARLHGQFNLPAPCLPSTAYKNGRGVYTTDINKHSCAEHSCGGGEFRVQLKQMSFLCVLATCAVAVRRRDMVGVHGDHG